MPARHHDTLTATLTSGRTRLPGASLTVLERTAPAAPTVRSVWAKAAGATVKDNLNGTYTITVTPPLASLSSTQKDQFEVVFSGETIKGVKYARSHSPVITVTVKRAR